MRRGTQHSLSCAVIAAQGDEMQRDYWYSNARNAQDMLGVQAIGRKAGERSVARLGARKLGTRQGPVLLAPERRRGFMGDLLGAISGGSRSR